MKKSDFGFTLIEFMVANVCTLIVLGGTFTLLTSIFTANSNMSDVMQTQGSVRVAMNTITRDITMAGTGLPTGGIAVPNGTNSAALTRQGVGGTLTTPNSTIAIISPGNGVGPTLNNAATDALTITEINQESPIWNVSAINSTGINIDFTQDVKTGASQLFQGDLLVFTNSNGSVFGCATSVSTTISRAFFAAADAMGINQPTAAGGNIKSLQNGDGTYPPTTATRMNVVTYYINNAVPAHPKLMRVMNAQTPQVLVEDVENVQFLFDLFDFTTNLDTASQATTTSPNQIRAVTVSVSGRSPQVSRRTGKYYRFSLLSKVNVRNATFRNRYTGS